MTADNVARKIDDPGSDDGDMTTGQSPVPFNEKARLACLRELDILDTLPDESIDRITALAASIFRTSIAVVTLLDNDRQWFKSRVGLDAVETPRKHAFCAHGIMDDEVMVVPDASRDGRFSNNPLVVGAPKVRFYAGAPLLMSSGFRLGTLCVIDDTPRPGGLDARECGILRDLSAMVVREIEVHLNTESRATRLASDLKNAQDAKNQFLQMLCHELRTPLNAVIGFSSLISGEVRGRLHADYRAFAENINDAGNHLLGMIDGMLEWTRLERGELRIEESPVQVSDLIGGALSLLPCAGERVELADVPDDVGLICDIHYATQAVTHIVENALRFSPDTEKVRISTELRAGRALTIVVEDYGDGIDSDRQKQAFDALERLADPSTSTAAGIGLGLAVSRKLLELHGGSLSMDSRPGDGTRVFLNFPDYRTRL